MKSKKTEPKAKVKIKSLKLTKETIENLSDADARAIKGGAVSGSKGMSEERAGWSSTVNHNEAFVCDEG